MKLSEFKAWLQGLIEGYEAQKKDDVVSALKIVQEKLEQVKPDVELAGTPMESPLGPGPDDPRRIIPPTRRPYPFPGPFDVIVMYGVPAAEWQPLPGDVMYTTSSTTIHFNDKKEEDKK